MEEMTCDVLRSTSCRYFNLSGGTLTYGSKEGCVDAPLPPTGKKQTPFCQRSRSFLYHASETSGDSRTLIAIPYVIICSIFSIHYASALTSQQREWAALCQPPRSQLQRGGRWGAGGCQTPAGLQLDDCAGCPSSLHVTVR